MPNLLRVRRLRLEYLPVSRCRWSHRLVLPVRCGCAWIRSWRGDARGHQHAGTSGGRNSDGAGGRNSDGAGWQRGRNSGPRWRHAGHRPWRDDDHACHRGGSGRVGGRGGAGALADLTPAMIGDQSPYSMIRSLAAPPIPPPFPPPRPGVSPVTRVAKSIAGVVPAVRGFKIADNQSPRPTDRVFGSFNYFDNVNRPLNERLGRPSRT